MAVSGPKRFWEAIKPPPRAGRHEAPESRNTGPKSAKFKAFWEAVRPPAAVPQPDGEGVPEAERRRRKRLLTGTALAILIGAGAWEVYQYVASAPKRAEAVLLEGKRLMVLGRFPDAIERFTKATDIWPEMAAGYFERGLAHQNLNQEDLALLDFEKALSVDPNLPEAHVAVGSIHRQRGDLKSAMNEFTLAIALGSNVDAVYQRGQTYESLGEHQKAVADYDLAIAQMPNAPYAYRARATARESLGDRAGAEEDRQKALTMERPSFLTH
jgi:tetratricopeptide (TPR) repeat protein